MLEDFETFATFFTLNVFNMLEVGRGGILADVV